MLNSVFKELSLVKELINEGKFEEALQHVKVIEKKKNLNSEETLRTLSYKGRIFDYLGHRENALKIFEDLYQKSQEMNMSFYTLDALSLKMSIFPFITQVEFVKTLEQYKTLFNSIPRDDSLEYQKREAFFKFFLGEINFFKGNYDLALDDLNKSLVLFKKFDPHSITILRILVYIAYCYLVKGEVTITLEYCEKVLSLIPKGEYYFLIRIKAHIYRCMGNAYGYGGDLNKTLEYHTRSLEIYEKVNEIQQSVYISWAYYNIIDISLTKKDLNQAQYYLQQFNQFCEYEKSKSMKERYLFFYNLYQLSHALILKVSPRIRDHVEAETILKTIVSENVQVNVTDLALIDLCDWYFEEFQISHQMEILDDIDPLIKHLLENARAENSYFLLANAKLFQAKLALLQINMVEARKLLTEAQKIADEHGLQLLAGEISKEHDRLLEELKLWESIKKTEVSVAERLKLASIENVLERMQGKRAIELPEFHKEEPMLLLIMDQSGVTYFNYSFVEDWDFTDLFSSFMSAFNAFSGEIFSKSIDRIKIGENTILINPVEPFLACYIIKGQSYPAQQKLTQFSETIKATKEIWDALDKATKTSEMLELNKPPSLGNVVNEIFIR
ncbi:MAG: hypothetical protein ACFFFT_14355 [Candidatus Thorarchaeota archaeon]